MVCFHTVAIAAILDYQRGFLSRGESSQHAPVIFHCHWFAEHGEAEIFQYYDLFFLDRSKYSLILLHDLWLIKKILRGMQCNDFTAYFRYDCKVASKSCPVRELSWFTIFYNYGSRWLQHVTTIVGVLNQPLGPLGTSYKVKRGVHLEGGFPVDQAYGFSPQ